MSIIIASKNIYSTNNQKVVNNKLNGVNYEYDDIVQTNKKQSYSYDIYDDEKKFNTSIETITNENNPNGKQTFAKVHVVFEDFGLEDIRLSLEYPRHERIRTDKNGNPVYDENTGNPAIDFGKTFREDTPVYSAKIDSPLLNNDSRLNTDDAWFWNFIIYKEYETRSKVSYICYFKIGEGYGRGWYSTANIHADYNSHNREEVSVDNNAKFSLPKNEFMQNKTTIQNGKPIYEVLSEEVVSHYKNGKETATIRCSISDYYDESGNRVIDTDFHEQKLTTSSNSDFVDYTDSGYWLPSATNYGTIWLNDFSRHTFKSGKNIVRISADYSRYGSVRIGDNPDAEKCTWFKALSYDKDNIIELSANKTLYFHFYTSASEENPEKIDFYMNIFVSEVGKMTFAIGDKVVPMVFGSGGKDVPMSRYNNGYPKQFKVVGRKMVYDGAVWQELTLQETTI